MTKKFYYYYEDALAAAKMYAEENDGMLGREISADDRSMQNCDYMDDESANLCWSGEVSAIPVKGEGGDIVAIFAYWCVEE